MSTSLAIPRNLQGSPAVQRLMGQLTTARRSAREARAEAQHALTPAVATAATQGGAVVAGGLMAYLPAQRVPLATAGLGLASILGGSVWQSAEAVAFGNGLLAPLVAGKTAEFLLSQRSGS